MRKLQKLLCHCFIRNPTDQTHTRKCSKHGIASQEGEWCVLPKHAAAALVDSRTTL